MSTKKRAVYGSAIAEMQALDPELAVVVKETMAKMTDGSDDATGLNAKITFMHKSVEMFNRVVVSLAGVKNLYSSTEAAAEAALKTTTST